MKYKSMGWMVCFSFMVDGVEDTWLFMCSKIQSTDLNGNQAGKMKRSLELVGQQDPGLAENAGDGDL